MGNLKCVITFLFLIQIFIIFDKTLTSKENFLYFFLNYVIFGPDFIYGSAHFVVYLTSFMYVVENHW